MKSDNAVAGAPATSTPDGNTNKGGPTITGGASSEFENVRLSSLPVSILNVVKTCIGAGILSLPWAFSYGSLWPSIFMFLFSAVYCLISAMLIIHGCEASGIFEYSALLRTTGTWVERAGALTVCYVTFSTCLGYCIIIPQFLQPAFSEMFGIERFSFDRELYILVIAPLILYPLCLLKDLSSLRFSSTIGLIAVFYCLILFVVESAEHGQSGQAAGTASDPDAEFVSFEWSMGIFVVMNVASKANVCHYALPPIYGELQDRSIKRMWIVMGVSYAIVTVVYVTFSVCGYYLFGSDSQGMILESYRGETGAAVVVARLGTCLSIFGCFPLIFKGGINALESQFFSKPGSTLNFRENPRSRVIVITLLIAFLTLLSLPLNDLGPVSSIEGAVTVLLIICAFPILIFWKVRFGEAVEEKKVEMQNAGHMHAQSKSADSVIDGVSGDDTSGGFDSKEDDRLKIAIGVLFALGIISGISGMAVSFAIL